MLALGKDDPLMGMKFVQQDHVVVEGRIYRVGMQPAEVIGLEHSFHEELPIGFDRNAALVGGMHLPDAPARDLGREAAQMVVDVRARRGPDESVPHGDRKRCEPGLVAMTFGKAVRVGNMVEPAIAGVCPAVIGAHEGMARSAAVVFDQACARDGGTR